MALTEQSTDYRWYNAEATCAHIYLWPTVMRILAKEAPPSLAPRVFDAGCGNGVTANWLSRLGYEVAGIDASHEGIAQANNAYPELRLEVGSVYDDLAAKFGRYPVVLSLEVIEHLYSPRAFTNRLSEVLAEGGIGIVSTPFHGYWKNLMLALSGKLDDHFTALWDGGHIKFWSPRTLSALLVGAGFSNIRFYRVGRIPPLAKSMIAVFRR